MKNVPHKIIETAISASDFNLLFSTVVYIKYNIAMLAYIIEALENVKIADSNAI